MNVCFWRNLLRSHFGIYAALACLVLSTVGQAETLTVYSARKDHLVRGVFEAYEKSTGGQVKINYITDKAPALHAKIKSAGQKSEADVLWTVDAGNLWHAAEEGLLAKLDSPELKTNIPSQYRDPENRWFGLSVRARTIAYAPNRVKLADLKNYADLATPKWKGKLCLRTSQKVYNQSLVAMLMDAYGEKKTEQMVKGWVNNLARHVYSNDTKLLEAIADGKCDVGVVNSYYFGRLQRKNPKIPVKLFFPKAEVGGVHVNISGAGVVATSTKKKLAQKFIEWLSQQDAQKMFADVNLEYPANPKVPTHPTVVQWGPLTPSTMNLSKAGQLQKAAIKMMDRARYQ